MNGAFVSDCCCCCCCCIRIRALSALSSTLDHLFHQNTTPEAGLTIPISSKFRRTSSRNRRFSYIYCIPYVETFRNRDETSLSLSLSRRTVDLLCPEAAQEDVAAEDARICTVSGQYRVCRTPCDHSRRSCYSCLRINEAHPIVSFSRLAPRQ